MHKKPCNPLILLAGFFVVFLLMLFPDLSLAANVALGWNPNNESDLAGYGAYYYNLDESGAGYVLFGYVALDELDDSESPTITVTGLDSGAQYQFAVTAYDASGNESAFSIPVCAEVGTVNAAIACPASDGGGNSGGGGGGSGGGGGGGGCFIRSISGGQDTNVLSLIGLSLIWLIASLKRKRNKAA